MRYTNRRVVYFTLIPITKAVAPDPQCSHSHIHPINNRLRMQPLSM